MKIADRAGHTQVSPGASKLVQENIVTREVLAELNNLLALHNEVINCHPGENVSYPAELSYGIKKANEVNPDIFFSLHANTAYDKYDGELGVEVCVHSTSIKGKEIGNKVCGNLSKLGFKNRGVKERDSLAECNSIKSTSMIIELFFLEATKDVELYKKLGAKRIAHAIGNAIDSRISFEPITNSTMNTVEANSNSIEYQAHVQDIGWMNEVKNGAIAGTTGKGLRLEAFAINYFGPGKIKYQAHMQNYGWTSERLNGEVLGTIGMSLRLESFKIWIEGSNQKLQYRAHVKNKGWLPWVNNGEVAGTIGESLHIEAIEIKLV